MRCIYSRTLSCLAILLFELNFKLKFLIRYMPGLVFVEENSPIYEWMLTFDYKNDLYSVDFLLVAIQFRLSLGCCLFDKRSHLSMVTHESLIIWLILTLLNQKPTPFVFNNILPILLFSRYFQHISSVYIKYVFK